MPQHTGGGVPTPEVIVLDDKAQNVTYKPSTAFRAKASLWLRGWKWQALIIGLILLDTILVIADIIIAFATCAEDHPPHGVEVAEEFLRYASIVILSFFILEWCFEGWVNGTKWIRTWIHVLDIIIISISLLLEVLTLLLHEAIVEVGSLLVIFRLWRVVRVMHAVGEVEHHHAHEQINSLKEANERLARVQEAHHMVIKGLHAEYTQRLKAVRANAAHAETANKVEHSKTDDASDAAMSGELSDMLDRVGRRSALMQESVAMHRQSASMAHRL